MKIKVVETTETVREVEVATPWYRMHDMSGDDYTAISYTKIDEDPGSPRRLRSLGLCHTERYGSGVEGWEIESGSYSADRSAGDYILGRGEYALSAEDWEAKRAEMEAWMRKVGALPPTEDNPTP